MKALILCSFALLLLLPGCGLNGELNEEQTPDSSGPDRAASPNGRTGVLTEEQILDKVWSSLEPNTSSRKRANWEVDLIQEAAGREVAEEFEGEPSAGCWMGPTPVPNSPIDDSATYWYVRMVPKPATPVPQERTLSPTEPPAVPEPFFYQAHFLLDPVSGRVVARRLICVVY